MQTRGRQRLEVGINVCYLLSHLHHPLLERDRWFLQTTLKVSLAFATCEETQVLLALFVLCRS